MRDFGEEAAELHLTASRRSRRSFMAKAGAAGVGGALLTTGGTFLPFSRLVQRGEHLHELWVRDAGDALDWNEHEAPLNYDDYFDVAKGWEVEPGSGIRHRPPTPVRR